MKFISYSQNREDVLLWRALQHVEQGFYIDVGANDPSEDSVTRAFYDRGWHGINIEPLPVHQSELRALRPRDINLATAAGASDGELTLFDVPAVRGWATFDPEVAQRHRDNGHLLETSIVPIRRLSRICEEHVSGPIHFLKIDVEGFEAQVVHGMDFDRWRPWVVVIEATLPGSAVANHDEWEPVLLTHRYRLAHFDGLNRFYLADEHAALMPAFATPPNVFDDYVFVGQTNAEAELLAATACLGRAEADTRAALLEIDLQTARANIAEGRANIADTRAKMAETRAKMAEARAQTAHQLSRQLETKVHAADQATALAQADTLAVHADLAAVRNELAAVYGSKSWRITAPIRRVIVMLQRIRARARIARTARTARQSGIEAPAHECLLAATPQVVHPRVHTLAAPARKVFRDLRHSGHTMTAPPTQSGEPSDANHP